MDNAYYLDCMGIPLWRCRSEPRAAIDAYFYQLGPEMLLLFDANTQDAEETALVEAIVKAVKRPYQGGLKHAFRFCSTKTLKVIIALGQRVAECVLQQAVDIEVIRGKVLTKEGARVVVTYSPQQLLQRNALKAATWRDVQLGIRQLA